MASGSTGDYFTSRNALLVAGGGGGAADSGPAGGAAGTPNGGNGVSGQGGPAGQGATTTALGGGYLGSNGTGGNGNPNNFNAAGGGGYYGGGGAGGAAGSFTTGLNGGGGGSSYVLPMGSSNVSYSLAGALANGALAITTVPTPTNNALAFDGAKDYVRIPDSNSLDFGAGNFTVEAWVLKQANSASYSNAIAPGGKWNTGASPGTNEWLLQTTVNGSDNLPSFLIESGTTTYAANGTTPVPLNLWTHLTGVRQGGSLLLYVNGVLQATTAIPAAAAVNNVTGRDLLLGAIANNGSTNYFATERLDELRIYNTALTAAQIQADMFSTSSVVPASQVA